VRKATVMRAVLFSLKKRKNIFLILATLSTDRKIRGKISCKPLIFSHITLSEGLILGLVLGWKAA
jgi:hypothetical protein